MSQMHNIIAAFIQDALADADVSQAVPGGWFHGGRVSENVARPYGTINVEEEGREYQTGFSFLAKYKLTCTVYGDQKVGVAGATQEKIAELFDMALTFGQSGIDTDNSQILLFTPIGGSIEEDENTIQGKDVILTKNVWRLLIQEI